MSILEIRDLVVEYTKRDEVIRALDGASLRVEAGDSIGLVGESGSGKSTVASAIGRLLPRNARYSAGSIEVDGLDVLTLEGDALRRLRREVLGFIPQDPVPALDPTMRIGRQLQLALRDIPMRRSDQLELMERVRMRDPERVLRAFPHEISGGMAQRVVISMTMARRPRILVADEPTAALDSSVRAEVTRLLFELAADAGSTVVWLSHDLRSVGRWCRRVAVMYQGKVVEEGPATRVLEAPTHPYTKALSAADPARAKPGERIETTPLESGTSSLAAPYGKDGR